jgi:NAD(P)-dependent dehydrogenase (short-subunit alcohol dehydrogenase family)
VTGASYGVGAATALALARAGHDLAITATHTDNLRDTVASLADTGARVVPLALDLRAQDQIMRVFGEALAGLGRIDALVNNAAVNLRRLALDVSPDDWDAVIDTNTRGTFFLCQQAARHWIGQKQPGCIVNVASAHAFVGAAERSTYGISKAAIVHMTKMLAVEWGDHGIRVNAVAPGRMQTGSPSRADKGADPAYIGKMLARIPLHRLATAEEVASAITWLAGAEAGSVTGQTIVLDGGLTAA